MQITADQAKAIRRKQADLQMTAKQVCQAIGISEVTYRKIRAGQKVRPTVYQKAMEWLAKDY